MQTPAWGSPYFKIKNQHSSIVIQIPPAAPNNTGATSI